MARDRLDPRVNAYRADLAAEALKGRVDAPRYVKGERRQVIEGSAPLRHEPRFDARLETELLFGEIVTVYDENEGWAWVQAEHDSHVGYAPSNALSSALVQPTHRISALRSFVFPAPDKKAPPLDLLSMNACVAVAGERDRFAELADGRFVATAHLAAMGEHAPDFTAVAEQFLGAPYLWGGRTSVGLDCSGLVQLALQAAGVACPRDTDMLEQSVGTALRDPEDLSALRRGDLIFWEGHVAIMLDPERLLHASAHRMAVAVEPLGEVVARIAAIEGPVTSVKRVHEAEAE